jgi:hypothetical protein
MNLENGQSNGDNKEKYAVVLPCNEKDFGHFVSGLLGKPQTIERFFNGTYELHQKDIENTYLLVEQRVHQQNEAVLIQFIVNVQYNDNSSVLHNSLQDFLSYREVRPLVPVAIHLTWIYLIKFRDKSAPEKQTIELSIGRPLETFEDYPYQRRHWHTTRDVYLRINHTARTWATDIEALLSGHIETLFKSDGKWQSFIIKKSGEIGLFFGICFFIIAVIGGFIISRHITANQLSTVNQFLTNTSHTINTDEKLNFMVTEYAKGTWPRFYFALIWYVILALAGSIVFGTWVGDTSNNQPDSFLLFTPKANEVYEKYLRRRRHTWRMFVISMVTSIITGVLANFIFAVISQKWLMK